MAAKVDVSKFNAAVKAFAASVPNDLLLTFQKKLALEVLSGIVKATPVDTGRARGNWQLDIGIVPTGTVNGVSDPTQVELAKLSALRPFQVIFITNNLDYIEFLEEGSSRQAPNGMIAITLARVGSIFP